MDIFFDTRKCGSNWIFFRLVLLKPLWLLVQGRPLQVVLIKY